LIGAAEGLEYRKPLDPGLGVRQAYERVRQHVARLTSDRAMSRDIETIAAMIREGAFNSL
jgi:histidine ammonia-lyase